MKIKKIFQISEKAVLCLLIAFVGYACSNSKPIKLVSNGKSQYSIVTPATPNAQEQRAAALLQKFVLEMSGCQLPIVTELKTEAKGIFIKEVGGLLHDGYRIRTEKKGSIYIDGGKSKGCVYGAVTILDKYLGCHLYSPKYKVIPNEKTLRLPLINEADSSVNSLRITHTINDFNKDQDLLDWHRITTIEQTFAKEYYCHTFTHRLVPRDEFYKTHPEYFALIDGYRVADQLCMSNKDVVKEVVKQMKKDMALQPDKLYWSASQNDGSLYCKCDMCNKAIEEEKSVAGPIIRFVNEVAKEFPDKIISTLAYYYSTVPPAITKPLDNVQIMFCAGDLAAWGKIAKHVYVWDYVVNYFHYQCPYPSLFHVQPQVQAQVKDKATEFFIHANIDYGMEFAELRLYLLSRIIWNPNVDVSATINEFLKAYYGNAAPYIRKYIDRLTEEYEKTKDVVSLRINTPPKIYQNTFLSTKNLADYNIIFDEAEKAVKGNDVFSQHVHVARMPLNFAAMEIGKHNMFGTRGWWDSTCTVRNQKMDEMLEDFYATCEKAGIGDINENSTHLKDYYKATKFTTSNEAFVGNLAFRKKVTADILPDEFLRPYCKGDLSLLTDGVRGDNDTRQLFWVGWTAKEFNITIDLGSNKKVSSVEMGALWKPRGRTLLPALVECFVSQSEKEGFTSIGKEEIKGDQLKEDYRHVYSFLTNPINSEFRYVKLKIKRLDRVPIGHMKAGMTVQTFIDEIVVK